MQTSSFLTNTSLHAHITSSCTRIKHIGTTWRYKNKSPPSPINNYSFSLRSETKGLCYLPQADELNELNKLLVIWSESKNKFSVRFLKCSYMYLHLTCTVHKSDRHNCFVLFVIKQKIKQKWWIQSTKLLTHVGIKILNVLIPLDGLYNVEKCENNTFANLQ